MSPLGLPLLLGALLGLVAAGPTQYFREEFGDGDAWSSRWVESKHKSDYGKFILTAGKFYGDAEKDKGIQTSQDARFYAISSRFEPFSNKDKTLVVQFTVKHEQNIDCGGGYVKLFPAGLNQEDMHGDSEYNVMFGPDICGPGTKKVHVIFNYKGKNVLINKDIRCKDDEFTHLYTLVVRPDNTYEVKIDNSKVESGSLEDDWDFLPPKKIKDPEAKKPDDWDERAKIDDPEDTKPEDWDKPEHIPDPDAKKPEDWDEEMDGEWEPPVIQNPEYKGEWRPQQIDNPDYKGKWVHPEIDNPEYTPDPGLYAYESFGVIGLDLWQVKSGTIFDNFLITDDEKFAEEFGNDTWGATKEAERKMKEQQDEEQRKKQEEEDKKRKEEEGDDEAEGDDEDDDDDEEEEGGGGEPAAAASRAEPQDAEPVPSGWRSCRQAGGAQFSGKRNWNAAKDLQRYRHRYPGLVEPENDEEEEMWNLSFYRNEICFLPQGLHIEALLESWWDNYEVLEENHSYIQWLFPLREHGMNWHAKQLTRQEIEAFKKSEEVMQRFERAYQLMLRFYGITLTNQKTGELERAENWTERFQNLNRFSHNNLRITRILKCLGEMGYEHYQVHLVKFFLTETLVKETLPNVKRSALDYFLFTIRSKRKRRELVHYAWQHFKPQSSFIWAPQDKLLKYRPCSAKTQLYQKDENKQEPPGKKSDDSVENDQKDELLEEEQKARDNADLQPEEVNEEDLREKLSEHVSQGGDGEEERDPSFARQEEKDLNSEAEEVQSTTENDCAKESKKRKLDASRADTKHSEPLKSPNDIEKISRNLGECAIDAEIPSSVPVLQTEEDQEIPKDDAVKTEEVMVPEAADAAVKRRKVDKRTMKGRTCTLAINLNMGPPAVNAPLNPPVANTETEEGRVSEKTTAVEEASENTGGDTKGGVVDVPAECKVPKRDGTSPVSDDLDSGGDQVTAESDRYHCGSVLLGCKSEADKVERHEKAEENANEKMEAKAIGKNQNQESLEQSMASVCPEQDSAEVAIQKGDSSQPVAESNEEQVATERDEHGNST